MNASDGQQKKARKLCKKVIDKYPNTDSEKYALYKLTTMIENEKTAKYLETLKEQYPEDPLTFLAREQSGEDIDWSRLSKKRKEELAKGREQRAFTADTLDVLEFSQPSPNPFNPVTNIKFGLPSSGKVNIRIYNILGNEVWSYSKEYMETGYHSIRWHGVNESGTKLSSGVYIIRLKTKTDIATRKVMLIK